MKVLNNAHPTGVQDDLISKWMGTRRDILVPNVPPLGTMQPSGEPPAEAEPQRPGKDLKGTGCDQVNSCGDPFKHSQHKFWNGLAKVLLV